MNPHPDTIERAANAMMAASNIDADNAKRLAEIALKAATVGGYVQVAEDCCGINMPKESGYYGLVRLEG